MSFRENLLKKIRIKRLVQKTLQSMGSAESGKRTDISAARRVLDMSPYTHQKERDLDLYVRKTDDEKSRIVVLGNDLPMYVTTVADVAMRRSPTLKEMISIRNAIKILNDTDIRVSKGVETLAALQKESVDLLDLSYEKSDLIAIAKDGAASLENAYQEGVIESISLFGELLGFQPPKKEPAIGHFHIIGAFTQKLNIETHFGPMILYGKAHNDLKFIDACISVSDKSKIEHVRDIAKGAQPATAEGPAVFEALIQSVLNLK